MFDLEQSKKILELTLGDYSNIRGDYWARVYDATYDYLTSNDRITVYKNRIKKAMTEAFNNAADVAYQDGGGTLPMDEDTQAWVATRQAAEFAYIDILHQNLKALREDEDFNPETDAVHEAFLHADGYAKTLDSIYSNVKVMAAKAKMLTLVGEDGVNSCAECQKYKGKRHRASWWIARNLVPGKGSAYTCGGWRCMHVLVDDQGMLFTL